MTRDEFENANFTFDEMMNLPVAWYVNYPERMPERVRNRIAAKLAPLGIAPVKYNFATRAEAEAYADMLKSITARTMESGQHWILDDLA